MNNRFGFTIIELMIAVSLTLIVTTTGVVYLNNFLSRQKLSKATFEVESMINQAQSYAKIKQPPINFVGQVNYVKLQKAVSGNIEASVNGTGNIYFSNDLGDDITLSLSPVTVFFWGGSGHLSTNSTGNFYNPNQKVHVTVGINQGIAETRVVVINSLGGVE